MCLGGDSDDLPRGQGDDPLPIVPSTYVYVYDGKGAPLCRDVTVRVLQSGREHVVNPQPGVVTAARRSSPLISAPNTATRTYSTVSGQERCTGERVSVLVQGDVAKIA